MLASGGDCACCCCIKIGCVASASQSKPEPQPTWNTADYDKEQQLPSTIPSATAPVTEAVQRTSDDELEGIPIAMTALSATLAAQANGPDSKLKTQSDAKRVSFSLPRGSGAGAEQVIGGTGKAEQNVGEIIKNKSGDWEATVSEEEVVGSSGRAEQISFRSYVIGGREATSPSPSGDLDDGDELPDTRDRSETAIEYEKNRVAKLDEMIENCEQKIEEFSNLPDTAENDKKRQKFERALQKHKANRETRKYVRRIDGLNQLNSEMKRAEIRRERENDDSMASYRGVIKTPSGRW